MALIQGDIALIGYITNGAPDSFSFVSLAPIAAGEVIYFTDNGWTGTAFRGASSTDGDGNENLIKFTAVNAIAVGTIIRSTDTSANFTWTTSGSIPGTTSGAFANLSLAQGGEQIAAFQSGTNNPLFSGFTAIFQVDNTGVFENATTTAEGSVVTGLSQAGNTAVLLNNLATYAAFNLNTLTNGTKAEWLAAINNPANWNFTNLTVLPTGSITVGSGGLPTVNLSVSSNASSESTTPTAITVTATATSAVSGNQTVTLTVSGTNITTGDYTLNNTTTNTVTITILGGQTIGTATFTVVDDTLVEGSETATLTISTPSSGITLGSTVSQNITITDNEVSATPAVNLSVSSNTSSETNPAAITVTATAASAVTGDQTVSLAVTGTNITPSDFNLSGTTITIPGGQTTGTQTFTVLDDVLAEGSETAVVTISSPSSGIVLGTTISQNIVITDNDQTVTKISAVQGSAAASTLVGTIVTIEGIVVGDYQDTLSGQIGGFFVQEEDADVDADSLTSEGISVFSSLSTIVPTINVNVGDKVRVTGTVVEFGSTAAVTVGRTLTQIATNPTVSVISSNNPLPSAVTVDLPVSAATDLERFEGMRVTFPEVLTVSETFSLARFGEIQLSADGRRFQPTEFVDPNNNPASGTAFNVSGGINNVAAVTAQQTANDLRAIILDDGISTSNSATIPYLNTQNTRRVGDTTTGLTGILDQRFGSATATGYRIQPTGTVTFADTNPRPLSPPDVGATANVKVGSFNLLNYFTTFDNGTNVTGPSNLAPRGAQNATEFARQRDKTGTTIAQLNADILGLIELENNGDTAITDLVAAVNAKAGAGTYAFIADPVGYTTFPGGSDAIKVAFIYKPSVVTPMGAALAPTNATAFSNSGRAPVAQTFKLNSNGAIFTPVVNHFKSKGGTATGANADQNDGQAAFNAQRVLQAQAVVDFVRDIVIPAANDPDVILLGDLNAYGEEDPVDLLRNAGYADQVDRFNGDTTAYSFLFQGQSGRLDYALANAAISSQITGAAEWAVNADEPIFLDYNVNFKANNNLGADNGSTPDFFNPAIPFRASDHDPVLVGLNLVSSNTPPTIQFATSTSDFLDGGVVTSPASPFAVSSIIADPTDPAKNLGINFTVADTETTAANLVVTATSSNQTVVPNANLVLSGSGANRTIKINPIAAGLSNITVTVTDGGSLSANYVINYGASAASVNPSTTRALTGSSDASTAIALDSQYMLVADDENQALRLYDRTNSGLPLKSFDFTSSLGLTDQTGGGILREVDIEASASSGSRIFWSGSLSNSSGGANRPNRNRIFATDITGTGANTTLTYSDRYDFIKQDLLAWDAANGNVLGLAASSATGKIPESADGSGLNLEALEFAPDGTTAYLAFRAPLENPTLRNQALIVPVTNFASLIVDGVAGSKPQGSATFGAPIFLNLGGRAIREIRKNASNEYVIVAGAPDSTTGLAPKDFRLYTWNGDRNTAPQLRSADLTGLSGDGGSYESIVEVPNPLLSTSPIQVLADNGDTVFYGNGTIAKELTQNNLKKSRSEVVTLGGLAGGTAIGNVITGTNDVDRLNGTTGNDLILGLDDNDRIAAGAGNDTIDGGAGTDLLIGSTGADIFVFNNFSDSLVTQPFTNLVAIDRISDFNQPDGDRLKLAASPTSLTNAGIIVATDLITAATSTYSNLNLLANQAVLFTWNSGVYLSVNDATPGFQANADFLVNLTGITFGSGDNSAPFPATLTVANYFQP